MEEAFQIGDKVTAIGVGIHARVVAFNADGDVAYIEYPTLFEGKRIERVPVEKLRKPGKSA